MKTQEELWEDANSLIASRSASLNRAIQSKDETDVAQITVQLRVSTIRQLFFVMAYNQDSGRRSFGTISSAVWQLIERSYKGILKKLKSDEGEEPKAATPEGPKTLDEALRIIEEMKESSAKKEPEAEEDPVFPDFDDL